MIKAITPEVATMILLALVVIAAVIVIAKCTKRDWGENQKWKLSNLWK